MSLLCLQQEILGRILRGYLRHDAPDKCKSPPEERDVGGWPAHLGLSLRHAPSATHWGTDFFQCVSALTNAMNMTDPKNASLGDDTGNEHQQVPAPGVKVGC